MRIVEVLAEALPKWVQWGRCMPEPTLVGPMCCECGPCKTDVMSDNCRSVVGMSASQDPQVPGLALSEDIGRASPSVCGLAITPMSRVNLGHSREEIVEVMVDVTCWPCVSGSMHWRGQELPVAFSLARISAQHLVVGEVFEGPTGFRQVCWRLKSVNGVAENLTRFNGGDVLLFSGMSWMRKLKDDGKSPSKESLVESGRASTAATESDAVRAHPDVPTLDFAKLGISQGVLSYDVPNTATSSSTYSQCSTMRTGCGHKVIERPDL
eukprot:gnl/MRDRNA2_/MRDRNA2_171817_c0_seq1.p1 gnl/MRDRNA2_/MRDRNA2_171817_c0~~gnl/MRDRNA2_/MRDRNA2_171817_c0_seq1.p1  ORF type:complete len:267 (-),score=38.21 gnl/MRDRNA2_/MRDRNA2_171817_c0_seq1:23-823(-)